MSGPQTVTNQVRKMEKTEGPQFLRFFVPIVETLKELGGSGRPAEVTDIVVEKLGIPDAEVEETLKSGMSRVKNQVHWARFYLAKSGFIDASQRGVWSLTEKGMEAQLNAEDAYRHFKEVQTQFKKAPAEAPVGLVDHLDADQADETPFGLEDYRTELLGLLKSLPPSGFERVCQRLLRESGFEKVIVTGRSGDGGIDGHGVIQINPFVSFKALFQSKRYADVIFPIADSRLQRRNDGASGQGDLYHNWNILRISEARSAQGRRSCDRAG